MHYKILFLIILIILYVKVDGEKSVVVDVYPGFGWDNLRFLDMTPIFDVSNFNNSDKFQSCIEVIPVRQNKIQLDSTVIDMFDSRTEDYSKNWFIGGSAGYMGFKIGGSFSSDYQTAKKQQGEEKTITLRNQIDYIMHDVILKSSCQLNPQVKKDLIAIAEYQINDQETMATYAAQHFVKTYGTHFTNRLSLGGSIIQEDFVSESAYHNKDSDKKAYHAEAQASFLGTFSITPKLAYNSTTNKTSGSEVKKAFTRKIIHSKGGKLSLSNGFIETWESTIDSAPVIVRRGIENITFFIQSDKIPELSEVELLHIREKLNEAIDTYVQMNVYSGCMDRGSPSFDWIANLDDGSCTPLKENSQFGGFIRTCSENSRLSQKCGNYEMLNYYTQTRVCPPNFDKHLLRQTTQTENIFRTQCRDCGFLWMDRCCEYVVDGIGERILNFYGCNKNKNQLNTTNNLLKIAGDYVYGGSFTDQKVNPITGTSKCPNEQFKRVPVTNDLTVCLAERVTDVDDLPHYGGIYSCDQGNIAFNTNKKECSKGYSTYVMGAIEDGCLLFVCLKFEKFPEFRQLPSIVLPPYFSIPLRNQTRSLPNGTDLHQTTTEATRPLFIASDFHQSNIEASKSSTSKGNNLTLGLSIGGIGIGILAIVLVTVLLIQNKKRQRLQANRTDELNLVPTTNA